MPRPTRPGRSLAWAVPVLAEAAALGRSVAFAWLIGPDELGRAMILALTVRLIEMASDVGLERLIVQAPDGNSAALQSNLHGVALLRGLAAGGLILALAPVLAGFFPDGPGAPAYAALSVIPLIRGVAHLDFRRAERGFRYGRMAVTEGGATLAMAASILPAAALLSDHRAMCVVLIAHAAAFTLLSHVVAMRRYRARLSMPALRRVWRFGAPLVLNAVLLFFTFHADRLIVAWAYDWHILALYGVALQLALLPSRIVGRAAASLVLPRLREAIAQGTLAPVWRRTLAAHAAMACAMASGFALVAPPAIALAYGGAFRPDAALALCLGLAAGFRILRTPYSQLAIATGHTAHPARANAIRVLALLPAAGAAAAGLPLSAIAAAAAAGEAGATLRAAMLAPPTLERPAPREVFA